MIEPRPLEPPDDDGRAPAAERPSAGYWLYAASLWLIFGIALSNIAQGLAALATPWLRPRGEASKLDRPARLGPEARWLLVLLAVYVVLLFASIALSYEPRASLQALRNLFTLLGLPLGLLLVRDARQARRIVDGVIITAVVIAAVGLSQYVAGQHGLQDRIRGPLSHYMTFAGVLMVADVLLIAKLLYRRASVRMRWAQVGGLVVINVALVASYTRSAWIGLTVGALILMLLSARRPQLLLVPVVLAAAILLPAPVRHRLGSIVDLHDPSNYDRICMARAGLLMVAERPFFGIGPELVDHRYPIYRHPTAPRYWVPHLHNSFLQIAAERGLTGLLSYLALMAASLAAAWRRYRAEGRHRGARADLLLSAFVGLIAFNVAGLFEHNWGDTEVQRLVLFLMILPFVSDPRPGSAPASVSAPGREPASPG
jgi:putative inorganic carbon (HCO3(-)) transporter